MGKEDSKRSERTSLACLMCEAIKHACSVCGKETEAGVHVTKLFKRTPAYDLLSYIWRCRQCITVVVNDTTSVVHSAPASQGTTEPATVVPANLPVNPTGEQPRQKRLRASAAVENLARDPITKELLLDDGRRVQPLPPAPALAVPAEQPRQRRFRAG